MSSEFKILSSLPSTLISVPPYLLINTLSPFLTSEGDLVAVVVGLASAQCQYLGFGGFFLGRIRDDNSTLRLLLLVLDWLNNDAIAERF